MPFSGIANPRQLATLTLAVDDFCSACGIVETARREDVAVAALALYARGIETADAIVAGLHASPVGRRSKPHVTSVLADLDPAGKETSLTG